MTPAQLAEYKTVVDAAGILETHFTELLIATASESKDENAVAKLAQCRTLARIARDFKAVRNGSFEAARAPKMVPLKRFANESNRDKPPT